MPIYPLIFSNMSLSQTREIAKQNYNLDQYRDCFYVIALFGVRVNL